MGSNIHGRAVTQLISAEKPYFSEFGAHQRHSSAGVACAKKFALVGGMRTRNPKCTILRICRLQEYAELRMKEPKKTGISAPIALHIHAINRKTRQPIN